MKDKLEDFIRAKVKFPKEEEIAEILNCFEIRSLKKGDYFKEAFTKSRELGFLVEGAMRMIIIKNNGEEVTARIIQENTIIADVFSIKKAKKTPVALQCVSDVSILVAPLHKINPLLQINLALNIAMREHITERALEMGENYMLFISGSAKERYQFILEKNPKLLEKFPLRFIASIIGITPTQLSRIRNKKLDS